MKIKAADMIEALSDLPLGTIEEARAIRRRRHGFLYAAATILVLLSIGSALMLGPGRAMIVDETPAFLAIDGKLYKRAGDLTALISKLLPDSCGQRASVEPGSTAEAVSVTRTKLPVVEADPSALPTEQSPGSVSISIIAYASSEDSVVFVGDDFSFAVPSDSDFGAGAIVSFYICAEDGEIASVSAEASSEELRDVHLSDLLPGFDTDKGLTVWAGERALHGEEASRLLDAMKEAESVSRRDFLRMERGDASAGNYQSDLVIVISDNYAYKKQLIFRDGRGTAFSVEYYPASGCVSAMGSWWFRLSDEAAELLDKLMG